MKLSIPTSTLKASIHCAATKDIRYYLNGVYLDTTAGLNLLRVVSTDGTVLSVFSHLINEIESHDATISAIVPLDIVKQAVTLHKKSNSIEFVTTRITDSEGVRVEYKLGGIEFKPVEGKFPDYIRVIPGRDSLGNNSNGIQYNPELLLRAKKALAEFYGANVKKIGTYQLDHNHNGGAGVMHDGDASALVCVMPCKVKEQSFAGYLA